MNSGQIYIVYVFLLSIAWFCLNKTFKFNNFVGGVLVGITASLRPPFVLLFIPFLISRRYSFLLGGLAGILFNLSLSFAVVDLFIWQKYLLAMFGMTGYINLSTFSPEQITIPRLDIVYPKVVEGFDFAIRNPLEAHLDNTSLYDVLNAIDIPNKRDILIAGFIITIVFFLLFSLKYLLKNRDLKSTFLFGVLICLICEFFIPVGRYSYYDVQMLLPLLILINQASVMKLISSRLIIFLLSGMLLGMGCFAWVPRFLFFSTYLITFYVFTSSLVFLKQEAKFETKSSQLSVAD
ncbi:DUF2029 domain-containing protein [Pleurocapsales cyanobacterium LEGE 10410]|nr:DUF2029 domain-containing protein [Pleurocapsales cyanobacterium LEGE 10410]